MRCSICNDCISQWEQHKCEEEMTDSQELNQIITALEKANMQLTSLGANNTNFCTDAIKLARELAVQESPSKELEQKGGGLSIKCELCEKSHDNWVGEKGMLCQECWEKESDGRWWSAMAANKIKSLKEQLTTTQQALDNMKLGAKENQAWAENAIADYKEIRAKLDSAVEALKEKQEPDFFYNVDEWDNTYHFETDAIEHFDFRIGTVLKLGRLVSLPHKYVIPNPDEECDDLLYFDTLEEAQAALASIKE